MTASFEITTSDLSRLSDTRGAEIMDALLADRHYWVTTVMFRVADPHAPAEQLLDAENLRGLIPIHCAICGTDDTNSATCTAESTAG